MKFQTHLLGGSAAGVITVIVSQLSGITDARSEEIVPFLNHPFSNPGDIGTVSGLFAITLFMSLFPDLDSASVLQRWFYRLVLAILIVLFLLGQMGIFAAITFIALLPLLHKHRGWTHSKLTPIILSLLFAIVIELHRSSQSWWGGFTLSNVGDLLIQNWIYLFACVLGHYTHLLLDWKF